tara:strand:- start:40 stop:324 length:285 start_codon:yes stop_codon:yes gene_type:complete
MGSITNKIFFLVCFFLLGEFLSSKYLAETKVISIINSFCIQNFKEEMLKANINYDEEIAKNTCDCYLYEFSKSTSHQEAINKCKLETKKKFNLK